MSANIDWENLGIPDYEDPAATKVRLDAIHRDLLEKKNISYRPEKNSPGFKPTAEQARSVAVMACLGLDPKDIALVLNIEEKLLKLYYAKELRVSHNLANAMVARQALTMAMSGRFPDMTKFWLKSRAGWNDNRQPSAPMDDQGHDELENAKDRLKQTLADALPKPGGPKPGSGQ